MQSSLRKRILPTKLPWERLQEHLGSKDGRQFRESIYDLCDKQKCQKDLMLHLIDVCLITYVKEHKQVRWVRGSRKWGLPFLMGGPKKHLCGVACSSGQSVDSSNLRMDPDL